jgi:kinesin family protein 6/9
VQFSLAQVHIAYVEIYNEAGYDLLDPAREGAVAGLSDLPRVGVLEDDDGRLHMRNLSLHCAGTEEEALNLVSC